MFNKKTNRFFALFFLCLIIGMVSLPIYAEGTDTPADDPVIEEWANVQSIRLAKTTTTTKLKLIAYITGRSGATFSNGTFKLVNSSGTTVAKWTGISSSTSSFNIIKEISKPASGTYTLSLTITATKSGVSEVVSTSYTFTI